MNRDETIMTVQTTNNLWRIMYYSVLDHQLNIRVQVDSIFNSLNLNYLQKS